jgi:DNA polymerase III epsilon subunit-like protein
MALQLSFAFQESMTFLIVVLVLAVISVIFALIFKSRQGRDQDSQITITQTGLSQNQLSDDDEPARPKEPPVVQPARSVRSEPASPKTRTSRTRRSERFEIPAMFATVDLETTGFSAGMDEIIEIGAIKCVGLDGKALEFSTLVRPDHPIPAGITATTGITQEMVDQDGVPLVEGIERLQSFLSCMPFIGYQVGFDVRFLKMRLGSAQAGLLK